MVLYAGGAKPSKGSSGGESSGGGSVDLTEVNAQINTLKNGKASTSLDNLTSSGNAKFESRATTSLDNLTSEGSDKFDGPWLNGGAMIQNQISMSTNTLYEYDLSSKLPDDGKSYLCLLSVNGSTTGGNGKNVRLKATLNPYQQESATSTGGNMSHVVAVTNATATKYVYSATVWCLIGAGRVLKVLNIGTEASSQSNIQLVAYRRMGE